MNQMDPTVQQLFLNGVMLHRAGKVAAAMEIYDKVAKQAPRHDEVLSVIAAIHFVQGRHEQGLAVIRQALEYEPGSVMAHAQHDRMRFAMNRAADPQTAIEIQALRRDLTPMEEELNRQKFYAPSLFWNGIGKLHYKLLEAYGVERFKRTVAHNYQNWPIDNEQDVQFKRQLELWPTHASSQPHSNSIEKPDDVGIHANINFPFYCLANANGCRHYALAVGLLWEYTHKNDTSGLLEGLEESQLGTPLQLRRKGILISSDICHSLRERNEILSAANLRGNESLTLGELGGGAGRLAEIFGRTTNYRYMIFDITPALYVAQWYIKRLFPKEKIFHFRHFESFSEIKDELAASRFAFFTANQIELMPPDFIHIFFNINSLMEMTHAHIENFLAHISRITSGYFFSQQFAKWKNPDDKIEVSREHFNPGKQWALAAEHDSQVHPDFFVQIWKKLQKAP